MTREVKKMEDILKLILKKLDNLEKGQQSLEKRMQALEKGQLALEKRQLALEKRIQALENRQEILEKGQQALSQKVDSVIEQTAVLMEFKTDVLKQLKTHALDINILKKAIAN